MSVSGSLKGIAVGLLIAVSLTAAAAKAQEASDEDTLAAQIVDTTRFKKAAPYKIGVSAGYLTSSWPVFNRQYMLWAADKHKDVVESVVVTDANFSPTKQVADIEDLLRQGIDLLIYWAVDEKSLASTLQRAEDNGVPTVNAFGGLNALPGTTSNAYISQFLLGKEVAERLVSDIGGKGKIVAILPIPGTQAAADQLSGLQSVLELHPDVELLNTSYGEYNRAKAKQVMENLLQRYPTIDGVFSPSGHMNIGIAEAIEESGRLSDIKMSPGDELNGWLKWVVKNNTSGAVTFPPRVGFVTVELGLKILSGEPVPRGQRIPSEYISPEAAVSYVNNAASDDSWAGPLPTEFMPK